MTLDRQKTWDKPHDIDSLKAYFPTNVVGTLLPPMDVIPDEFKKRYNKWREMASKLFFLGGQLPSVKPGIDPEKAQRHLIAVLQSFEPQHEHKEAGAGWLMSMWYEMPEGGA